MGYPDEKIEGCGNVEAIPAPFLFYELNEELATRLYSNNEPPHRHAYQEIIWIRQGIVKHLLDDECVEYPAQTILVIPKGRIHRLIPKSDCRGMAIRFTEEFLSIPSFLLFSQFAGQTALQLNSGQAADIEAYFSLLHSEHQYPDPYNLHATRHLLSALVAKLESLRLVSTHLMPHDVSSSICTWNRFNTLIEQKFKTEHTVRYFALKLGISPRKLGQIVKLYTGRHVSSVIDNRLITEAKRLILFSDLTIKEIAFELGFEEHSYFSKVFKKITGSTPSEFKKKFLPA